MGSFFLISFCNYTSHSEFKLIWKSVIWDPRPLFKA